ncbi:GPI biosynthesis protein family Pig-F-domain-containing protein [Mucidula mucida]|nr:GPI biosynthesis protein family Pig-F-domain-containing protein [Mucidula mucida]
MANAPFFPFARYTSIVGVHTSLLAFVALFFPRMFIDADMEQSSSKDRPQHPFLVALTTSPTITVSSMILGVVVLQAWWGGWIRDWLIDYSLNGSDDARRLDKTKINERKTSAFINAWAATLVVSLVFHFVIVLFGAPIFSSGLNTYLLSLLISLLSVFAPAYTYGTPSLSSDTESMVIRMTWTRLFAEFSIRTPVERAIAYPSAGAIIGCWLGAIPIALDWDRPWQAWPLTPAFGGLLGYILASIAALTISAITALAQEDIRRERLKTS